MLSAGPEQIAHLHLHPSLASTACTWALRLVRRWTSLARVADELSQLPQRRRRHPRLGQAPHAQQVDQVCRVALVLLHPAVTQLLPSGWARCTFAPHSPSTSAAQYQP